MRAIRICLLITCLSGVLVKANAQTPDTSKLLVPIVKDSTNTYLTLKQCIDYAMEHQPAINRALINVDIAKTTNAINLSGWLPQINANGDLIHYIQQNNNGSAVVSDLRAMKSPAR